jgi:hypothetical protein
MKSVVYQRGIKAMKTKYEQLIQDTEIRTKLWREFVTNYQQILEKEPEKFSMYAEKFRDRYLHAR